MCLSGEDSLETDVVDLNQQVVCLCVLDSATTLICSLSFLEMMMLGEVLNEEQEIMG